MIDQKKLDVRTITMGISLSSARAKKLGGCR